MNHTCYVFQLHGQGSAFKNSPEDDGGRPPYPIMSELPPEDKEYVMQWMDHYISQSKGKVVGFLSEFLQQQLEGKTDWKYPFS